MEWSVDNLFDKTLKILYSIVVFSDYEIIGKFCPYFSKKFHAGLPPRAQKLKKFNETTRKGGCFVF